jgi:hypothetical protein
MRFKNLFNSFNPLRNCIQNKQWPLADEFVEFEYSPKIRQFGEFEYSPKWHFGEVWPDSIHLPAIRQLLSPDSIHLRKANLHEFSEFSEFSKFGEFSECRLDRFIHKNIFFCI